MHRISVVPGKSTEENKTNAVRNASEAKLPASRMEYEICQKTTANMDIAKAFGMRPYGFYRPDTGVSVRVRRPSQEVKSVN